jgi:FkbM family methyltransferase
VIESVVQRFDYRLADASVDPTGLAGACERLKRSGFDPRTVIDVGVGNGTPWLYSAFPKAKFILFEPLRRFDPSIQHAMRGFDYQVHYCALGEKQGTMNIAVNEAHPTSSSMATYSGPYLELASAAEPDSVFTETAVPVMTLDDFAPFAGPAVLKLDVEGFEGHVLRGGHAALRGVDIIISEVSVARRTDLELSFGALVSCVEGMGFSVMNIAEIKHIGRNGAIAYMDVVFARSDSDLRYR